MITINSVTALMTLVLLSAFIFPFVYFIIKNIKKEKLIIQKLHEAFKSEGIKLAEVETWRQLYALGLDSKNGQLAYYMEGNIPIVIYLSEVKKVSVYKKTRELTDSETKKTVIDYIGLEVQYSSGKKSTHLEIYNEDQFSDLSGEGLLAEKWAELINKQL